MSVSVKSYLAVDGDEKLEIRRFLVASGFLPLQQKLMSIYPSLKQTPFTVQWKDDEGDFIAMSSDEEMMSATAGMKDDVLRVYIKVVGCPQQTATSRSPGKEEEEDKKNKKQADAAEEAIHPYVTCDGCDKAIYGFRYKCVECPDYDLCRTCENRKLHPQHVVLRLPAPMDGNTGAAPFLSCLFGRHGFGRYHRGKRSPCYGHHRRHHRHGDEKESDDQEEASGSDQQQHQRNPQNPYPFNFNEVLGKIWTTLGGLPREQDGCPGAAFGQNANPNIDPDKIREDFLKSVGQTVAAVLDPLGIDVDVGVEHNGKKYKMGQRSAQQSAPANTKEATKEPAKTPEKENLVPVEKNVEELKEKSAVPAAQPAVETAVEKTESPMIRKHAHSPTTVCDGETGDWTYIGDREKALIPPVLAPMSAATVVPAAIPHMNGAKPKVSGPPTTSLADEMVEMVNEAEHPNPAVRHGLEHMLSMGFTNEGGWLTQLLEVKSGDIDSVLEVLAPVNKNKH